MTSDLHQRIEHVNKSCQPISNPGSLSPKAPDKKNAGNDCTMSLTSCYKHQWNVVFLERESASTTYPSTSVARTKENAKMLCR